MNRHPTDDERNAMRTRGRPRPWFGGEQFVSDLPDGMHNRIAIARLVCDLNAADGVFTPKWIRTTAEAGDAVAIEPTFDPNDVDEGKTYGSVRFFLANPSRLVHNANPRPLRIALCLMVLYFGGVAVWSALVPGSGRGARVGAAALVLVVVGLVCWWTLRRQKRYVARVQRDGSVARWLSRTAPSDLSDRERATLARIDVEQVEEWRGTFGKTGLHKSDTR